MEARNLVSGAVSRPHVEGLRTLVPEQPLNVEQILIRRPPSRGHWLSAPSIRSCSPSSQIVTDKRDPAKQCRTGNDRAPASHRGNCRLLRVKIAAVFHGTLQHLTEVADAGSPVLQSPAAGTMPCREDRESANIFASARSSHRGGVNAALGDGSVGYYADDTAVEVWQALCTRSGNDTSRADP